MYILVVSEHDGKGSPVGMLAADLTAFLRSNPTDHVRFLHVRRTYRPGGLRLSRLINYLQLHLLLPPLLIWLRLRALLVGQPLIVISTTNPPLIHWNASLCGRLLGAKTIIWFQDANIDFLQRRFGSWGGAFAILNFCERLAVNNAHAVVTLDNAMQRSLQRRLTPKTPILVSPPWATYLTPAQPLKVRSNWHNIKILYAGNYGKSHDLQPLADLLATYDEATQKRVALHFIGMSDEAQRHLAKCFATFKGDLSFFDRLASLDALVAKMREYDLGLVSLAADYAGISAPSKAFTYLSQGVPILYVGPAETGADQIVRDGWGIDFHSLEAILRAELVPDSLAKVAGRIFPNPRAASLAVFSDVLSR